MIRQGFSILCFSFLLFGAAYAEPSLQEMVNAAKAGDTITLENRIYKGPIMIETGITLDGQGKASHLCH